MKQSAGLPPAAQKNLFNHRLFIVPSLLFFFWVNAATAQEANPCNMQWGSLQTILSNSLGNVYLQVQSSSCNRSGGICGWPKVALEHSFPEAASISVRLRGVDCDGKTTDAGFSTGGNRIAGNQLYKSSGNWHTFRQVQKVLRVEVWLDRGGDKYQILFDEERGINRVMKNGRPVASLSGSGESPVVLPHVSGIRSATAGQAGMIELLAR